MSTIRYQNLPDPEDANYGTFAPYFMFGSGLIREGHQTRYEITGRDGITLEFVGTDFVYDGKGRLVSGNATSLEIRTDGELCATVTDINVGAAKLRSLNSPEKFFDLLGKMDVEGSAGQDYLVAGAKNDVLRGGDGDDVLATGGGKDKAFGGDGDDAIVFGEGRTLVDGGSGMDFAGFGALIESPGAASDLRVDLREDGFQKIAGGVAVKLTSIESFTADAGDDKLTGDALANVLTGGDGRDTIIGGAGDDTINGGDGDDVLKGGAGYDTLYFGSAEKGVTASLEKSGVQTGAGKDKFSGFEDLTGSFFNDKLTGDANSNHIEGGAGDDTITGGGGVDGLVGGGGADTFVFDKASVGSSNRDEIADFEIGIDLMNLSKVDANALLDGNQDFSFIDQAVFTGAAGQLRWSYFGGDPSRDILISGDLDGDKVADFLIQLRAPIGALSASDFDF